MTKPDARAQLRAAFPESDGWEILLDSPSDGNAHAVATNRGPYESMTRVAVYGHSTDGVYNTGSAVKNAIAVWEAATHAEKVRELVALLAEIGAAHYACGCGRCTGCRCQSALTALPEHWKEGVRGK